MVLLQPARRALARSPAQDQQQDKERELKRDARRLQPQILGQYTGGLDEVSAQRRNRLFPDVGPAVRRPHWLTIADEEPSDGGTAILRELVDRFATFRRFLHDAILQHEQRFARRLDLGARLLNQREGVFDAPNDRRRRPRRLRGVERRPPDRVQLIEPTPLLFERAHLVGQRGAPPRQRVVKSAPLLDQVVDFAQTGTGGDRGAGTRAAQTGAVGELRQLFID